MSGPPDLPIGNTVNDVAFNVKAFQILRILYGFNTPYKQCATQIASGVAKLVTTSKTIKVEQVTDLHNLLGAITKHFESSIKSKELLDKCLSILEVQPIRITGWRQTRIGYFFKACTLSN